MRKHWGQQGRYIMTDYEIQCLRKKIQNELGYNLYHQRIAFACDEEGGLNATHIYYLNEEVPTDEQNNAIINGKKYKVLSARDSMMFYLQDLYDNTVEDMHKAEDKMEEVEDKMKETVESLNRLNNLIKKINKNMGKINDLDQAFLGG